MHVASISHGKDSIAMLHVIRDVLDWELDRIITVDVWFDDELRAELPPMVEWKEKADKIILDRWGIPVEHLCAMRGGAKQTYRLLFDRYGFPCQKGAWCNSKLKVDIQEHFLSHQKARETCGENNWVSDDEGQLVYRGTETTSGKFSDASESEVVQYLGIAYDETERVERHRNKKGKLMPLVEARWTEQMCYDWCEKNDLLAPTYKTSMRDGCWFCHNQGVGNLRNLYHNYPDLWEKLLALDKDSPVTFKADGHTVHDFNRRFKWEDAGYKPTGKVFRWSDLDVAQSNIFQFIGGNNG